MEAVREILEANGVDVEEMDYNDTLEYDKPNSDKKFVIEKDGDQRLAVGEYRFQRMDLMREPEVVFDVSDYQNWKPVEYTNHETIPQVYERDYENGLDLGFLEGWNKDIASYPVDEFTGGEDL